MWADLIRATYLIGAGLAGYGVYHLTTEPAVTFLPLLAGLAVAAAVNRLLEKWGRHLAGFTVDWKFLRGAALVRYLLRVAVGAAVAGSSRILSHYWWAFLDAAPLAVYRWLREQLGTAWLAVPVTVLAAVLVALLLYVTVAVVATVLKWIIAQVLGPGNAASRWLAAHAAMTWVRAPEGTVISGGPLLPFSYSSSFPNRPGPRTVARQRRRERPLSKEEHDQLVDRIAEAALAAAPEHPYLRLTYRAAGGHEEIVLAGATTRFAHWSDRFLPESEAAPAPEVERELAEFPECTALRRLREAAYRAGYGAPFTLHVTVDRPEWREAPRRRYWREVEWELTEAGAPRPASAAATAPRGLRRRPASIPGRSADGAAVAAGGTGVAVAATPGPDRVGSGAARHRREQPRRLRSIPTGRQWAGPQAAQRRRRGRPHRGHGQPLTHTTCFRWATTSTRSVCCAITSSRSL